MHNLGLQVSVETGGGKTHLHSLFESCRSCTPAADSRALRPSARRPERQPQRGRAGGAGRRVGEAALHGGVLQSQRSAHSLAPLRRREAPAAESQPVHATAGRIQRPGPSRSVSKPVKACSPGTSGQVRLLSAPFRPRANVKKICVNAVFL